MIANSELSALIEEIKAKGATVVVNPEQNGEGRWLIGSVQITGIKGIGPEPMGPIAVAEAIRDALARISEYENKLDAKRDRLEARADNLQRQAAGYYRKADMSEEATGIPFGQPILVGHHSEGKHRRAIARADAAMRKAIDTSKAAGEAAARAANIGSGGISSDDPTAIAQLREKLAVMETNHKRMVDANKLLRKGDDAGLLAMGFSEGTIAKLKTPPYQGGPTGFPSYSLSNSSANMKRVKDRIAALERTATAETKETLHNSGVKMVENVDANRVQLIFSGKPDADVRTRLKQHGFRWSPSEGAWQRHLNNAGRYAAKVVLDSLLPSS